MTHTVLQPALQESLSDLLGAHALRITSREQIKEGVQRLGMAADGRARSVIVKWSDPAVARRCELVAHRWLPAVGLQALGPPLIGLVARQDGEGTWHVYEDLAGTPLATQPPDDAELAAAMDAIARVHTAFAGHRLLPECRHWGGDRGIHFYAANLHDAEIALGSLSAAELLDVRDVLAERVARLRSQESARAEALAACGPDTLLHGDLWPTNVIVPAHAPGAVRLIDWDEAGAGPAVYDLSTILLRFEPVHRARVLAAYRDAVARHAGWDLPATPELELAMQTAAEARLASLLVWSIAAAGGEAPWLLERLTSIVSWLEAVKSVLPAR